MAKKRNVMGIFGMVLIFSLALAGCESESDSGSSGGAGGISNGGAGGIPAGLVGSWGKGNTEWFKINSNGSGTCERISGPTVSCTWSVSGNTLTLNITGLAGTGTVTWAVSNNKLTISNVGGSGDPKSFLALYVAYSPFSKLK
jgi:hypothetical protein